VEITEDPPRTVAIEDPLPAPARDPEPPRRDGVRLADFLGRIGLADIACVGPIIAANIYFWASIPLGPSLIGSHPLLLSGLRGTASSMISSGAFARVGRGQLWVALLVPVPITAFAAPFSYWAGVRYGRRFLDYLAGQDPKTKRRIERGERFFARWGAWAIAFSNFLPVPNELLYLAAGESRMPLWRYAAAVGFATMTWIGLYVSLGWFIGQPAVDVAQAISHYGLWLTIGLVVVIFVLSFRRALKASAPAS
jgi:membrane protein DedA with SNARE-associated domain